MGSIASTGEEEGRWGEMVPRLPEVEHGNEEGCVPTAVDRRLSRRMSKKYVYEHSGHGLRLLANWDSHER